MKTLLIIFFSTLLSAGAGPIKKSDLSPLQDKPTVPGSDVPLERMNTAPTDPPLEQEAKESRFLLKAREQKEEQLMDEESDEPKKESL